LIRPFRFRKNIKADFALLLLCVVWGTSFPLVRSSVQRTPPALFLAVRFWIGVLLLTPLVWHSRRNLHRGMIPKGLALGVFMFIGMFCQTLGLKYTTASNSGFLTALSVVLVPVWGILFRGTVPGPRSWAGILLATAGVYFLTAVSGGSGFNRGDILTVLSAVSFSVQIVLIAAVVGKGESIVYAWMMLFWTALFASLAAPFFGPLDFDSVRGIVPVLLYLGGIVTAAAFWGQTHFQPKTTATAAAVIFATEPVFAVVFAWMILGERLNPVGWIGAILILAGILVHETAASPAGSKPIHPSPSALPEKNGKARGFPCENRDRA
jgi:drug/metabolite transporter (DMT)-like permease